MRTLKVKCPTWKHVETFYKRKLRRDKTLTIRVPFNPAEGSGLTIRLQLPDGQITNIEGRVLGVLPGENPNKAAITLHLHGFTDDIAKTLRALVKSADQDAIVKKSDGADAVASTSDAVAESGAEAGGASDTESSADDEVLGSSVNVELPAAEPRDAPIDEVVRAPYEPDITTISEFEREVFEQLQSELINLREFAANEVLGVARDASVEDIRNGYFARTKHFHPDVFARYRSVAVTHMAQEVFIHINRAYDRMREAAVSEGRAVLAGPALLPHDGWLASLDDMAAAESEPGDEAKAADGASTEAMSSETDAVDMVFKTAEEFMVQGDYEHARSFVASALHGDPRNRRLRALYYLIGGKQALADGDTVLAASQFDSALAHDREYQPAREALQELRARGEHGGVLPKSLR